jgi:hypothetical protein
MNVFGHWYSLKRINHLQYYNWGNLVPFLPGRAAAKGLQPRAAACHQVTTKLGRNFIFFWLFRPAAAPGRKTRPATLNTVADNTVADNTVADITVASRILSEGRHFAKNCGGKKGENGMR